MLMIVSLWAVKKMTDIELKKASILDLTDDLGLMRKAMDDELFEVSDAKMWGGEAKRLTLYEYGIFINNDTFLDRLDTLFEKENALFFNE